MSSAHVCPSPHQVACCAAEYKVEYLVQPHLKEQIYDLRLFLFFPEELDAASTSFFSSLYESVRLHTPTVSHPCHDLTGLLPILTVAHLCT